MGGLMSVQNKRRFSVTLDEQDYILLKDIADSQKPTLSLQYIVAFALTEFISKQQSSQFELDLTNRPLK